METETATGTAHPDLSMIGRTGQSICCPCPVRTITAFAAGLTYSSVGRRTRQVRASQRDDEM